GPARGPVGRGPGWTDAARPQPHPQLALGGLRLLHQPGGPAGGLVLVHDALPRRLAQTLLSRPDPVGSVVGAGLDALGPPLDAGLEIRARCFVPHAPPLVLAVPLDLALDVRHARLEIGRSVGDRVRVAAIRSRPDLAVRENGWR